MTIPESICHELKSPLKLYRYVSTETTFCGGDKIHLESVRDNILQERVWFSSINKLNDPFEGRLLKSNYKIEVDNILEMNNTKTAVCCFSETKDNLAMWTHYAAVGKGICLEYGSSNSELSSAKPIKYISSLDESVIKV